jgi:hypothetical protein
MKKKSKEKRWSKNSCSDNTPPPDTKIHFYTATAYVRNAEIHNHNKPVPVFGGHRGIRVTLEIGYILIERRWFSTK